MKSDEFADLALGHAEELMAYARRLTASDWDADDLVQVTYERAFLHSGELREAARCRAWLFRICRNLHVDRLRSEAARPVLRLVDDGVDSAPAMPLPRFSAGELEKALAGIDEDQRETVLLCDLWGFPYEEAAAILDVPVGTVRSRLSRGRSAIARRLLDVGNQPISKGRSKS